MPGAFFYQSFSILQQVSELKGVCFGRDWKSLPWVICILLMKRTGNWCMQLRNLTLNTQNQLSPWRNHRHFWTEVMQCNHQALRGFVAGVFFILFYSLLRPLFTEVYFSELGPQFSIESTNHRITLTQKTQRQQHTETRKHADERRWLDLPTACSRPPLALG